MGGEERKKGRKSFHLLQNLIAIKINSGPCLLWQPFKVQWSQVYHRTISLLQSVQIIFLYFKTLVSPCWKTVGANNLTLDFNDPFIGNLGTTHSYTISHIPPTFMSINHGRFCVPLDFCPSFHCYFMHICLCAQNVPGNAYSSRAARTHHVYYSNSKTEINFITVLEAAKPKIKQAFFDLFSLILWLTFLLCAHMATCREKNTHTPLSIILFLWSH